MDRSFFRFVTIDAFDRQTDGRTEFSSLGSVCIACSAVKVKSKPNTVVSYIFNKTGRVRQECRPTYEVH